MSMKVGPTRTRTIRSGDTQNPKAPPRARPDRFTRASRAAQVAIGQLQPRYSAKPRAASTGALASAELVRPRLGERVRRGLVAALVGIALMAPNFTTPVMAQNFGPSPKTERVLQAPKSPLALRLDRAAQKSPAVQKMVDAATRKLSKRVNQILNSDAGSLAEGKVATVVGADLSAAQQTQLQKALTDYVLDLPVGALSDGVQAGLRGTLQRAGVDVSKLEITRLGDVSKYGAHIAKDMVKEFKSNHRGLYKTLLGVGGAGAAYLSYAQGSDALTKLGIKPKFSKKIAEHYDVSASLKWGKHFSDVRGDAMVTAHYGHEQLGAGGSYDGAGFTPKLSYNFNDGKVNASANWLIGSQLTGKISYKPSVHTSYSVTAKVGDINKVNINYNTTLQNDASLSLQAGHDFSTNDFNAKLSYGFQPTKNSDLQIRAGYENGSGSVGVGYTINW